MASPMSSPVPKAFLWAAASGHALDSDFSHEKLKYLEDVSVSHLESLIVEYLDWQGYLVKKNMKVGRLKHGGWEMELDVIGFNPHSGDLVHYEPSVDAHKWDTREARYERKFNSARKYILTEVFSWLPKDTKIRHIAVFPTHPKSRDEISGGAIQSIDELILEIRQKVISCGIASRGAISESYPLLRMMQLSHNGYNKALI